MTQPLSLPQAARSPRLQARRSAEDGELEDKDEAIARPGFWQLSLHRRPVAGGAWWHSVDPGGDTQGGVGPRADDDIMPGFGGGSVGEVHGLGNGRGRFGGTSEWAYD